MERFSIKKRLNSFVYAWKGIQSFVCREHNAWIHCTLMILVVIAGYYFRITQGEWIAVVLCFGLVLAAEGFNSAMERLVNLVSPEKHLVAGDVKDIAAGAVLICAIAAAIIGLIIFVPHLIGLF